MPYFQTKQGGDVSFYTAQGTTGGATADIPNYGISVITNTSAEVYALAAPTAGVQKTIVFHTYSTTALPAVRMSTATGVVSILGKTTGRWLISSGAAKSTECATVVQLMGVNSTSWVITNVWPVSAGVTTGTTIVATGVTLSS